MNDKRREPRMPAPVIDFTLLHYGKEICIIEKIVAMCREKHMNGIFKFSHNVYDIVDGLYLVFF